jgi:plasmid stability protein
MGVDGEEAAMVDLLVRGVPEDVVAAIDLRARQLGLSRTAYVRRVLVREAAVADVEVAVEDLAWFGEVFADLADAGVMRRAWE